MKILVVDDHVLIREALCGVLRQLQPDAVILEAAEGLEAKRIAERNPDLQLILLDLNLPNRDGFSLLDEFRERHRAVPVVVLSAYDGRENVVKALEHGAAGFIPKNAKKQVIVGALNLILAGGVYIPQQALAVFAGAEVIERSEPIRSGPAVAPSDLGLTGRQVDVLALMMEGKSNKGICRRIDVAEPTVKNHVTAILKALNVTNRTEAVVAANALGWTPSSLSLKK